MDLVIVPMELKLAAAPTSGAPTGEFSGYAAVFGNVDSHGDVLAPGAFKESLAGRAASGRKHVPMHVQHAFLGGDGLPIGVWKTIAEDDRGLKVEGKISGMETDAGRLHYARLQDGAYGGLSIGFNTVKARQIKAAANGGKRMVEQVDLKEISLVTDPSNAHAIIQEVKSRETRSILATPSSQKAAASIAALMALHQASLAGGNSPTADQRGAIFGHMQDAHEALTGMRLPEGLKVLNGAAELRAMFLDMGVPADRADTLVAEAVRTAQASTSGETKSAIAELSGLLSGFKLPLD